MFYVPVVDSEQKPLMPTTLLRARRWIALKKATFFYKKGILCVRLNQKPSNNKTQVIGVGGDTGSKREAVTVKSEAHTYLNILMNAVDWVRLAVKQRKNARGTRRNRKTPYRKNRLNRSKCVLPPSTKARKQLMLRVFKVLAQIFPITGYVIEDICADSKKCSEAQNKRFSPLQAGKNWFYAQIRLLGPLKTMEGWETKESRDYLGLTKSKNKLEESFDAHNVDSWVLANKITGSKGTIDNKSIVRLFPLRFHRRRLHRLQYNKGGIRKKYGGTVSLGFTKVSLVRHKELGVVYVGGSSKDRISLHDIKSGIRINQNTRKEEIQFLCYNNWNINA